MFMCFACNTGGDHITFVEKYTKSFFQRISPEEIAGILNFDLKAIKQAKKNPEKEMHKNIEEGGTNISKDCGANSGENDL